MFILSITLQQKDGWLTNERVGRVVLTGAHPQPMVLNATLRSEKEESENQV